MKAFLMYRDRDVDPDAVLPSNEPALTQDLELDTLLWAMAAGDKFLYQVVRAAVFTSLGDPDQILYRQRALADCLAHPVVIRELYAISVEAIERERRVFGMMLGRSPDGLLHRSVEVLQLFVGLLRRLRGIAEQQTEFRSEAFTTLFAMLARELDDEYMATVEEHLRRLKFPDGVLVSAELGLGLKGRNYVLRRPATSKRGWLQSLLGDRSGFVYQLADRDEAGYRALAELRERGIAQVASALAQSTDHILSFFAMLRAELGFYVGCLNLHDRLAAKGEPVSFPEPLPAGPPALSGRGVYDVCLSLSVDERVTGNDVSADGRAALIITGANRGGKSTFLRSLGLAQLMMQCGMFVPAEAFRADVRDHVFTHFRREEDATMRSGKLDEELSRMRTIVDAATGRSMVLLNESFASTNEREGSEIARQIVRALLDAGVKVAYVTHMYDLAHGFSVERAESAVFLRAERQEDGVRTFRVLEGAPLPTSFGGDLYRRIFGQPPGAGPISAAPEAGPAGAALEAGAAGAGSGAGAG
jgi:adenosyl cobinamide kinase/adenosyl cobinamide phosphate guanylyltransferase